MAQYLGTRFYCNWCMAAFSHKIDHRFVCTYLCWRCLRPTKAECDTQGTLHFFSFQPCLFLGSSPIVCTGNSSGCGKLFNTQACYDEHKKRMCNKEMYCKLCNRYGPNDGTHDCILPRCSYCGFKHPRGAINCYIRGVPKKVKAPYRTLVMDCECMICGEGQCDGSCQVGGMCAIDSQPKIKALYW